MNIIVCVDDNGGMMFNHRRVSRDAVLIQRIMEMTQHSKLWISSYSKELFDEQSVVVEDNFLGCAAEGEYCFVENRELQSYIDIIEKLIICKWNRRYPSDFVLDLYPVDEKLWQLVSENSFAGKSHEKIDVQVWERIKE